MCQYGHIPPVFIMETLILFCLAVLLAALLSFF